MQIRRRRRKKEKKKEDEGEARKKEQDGKEIDRKNIGRRKGRKLYDEGDAI